MERKMTDLSSTLAECVAMCNYCLNACLEEKDVHMMVRCIKLDKDCAEICETTLSFITSASAFTRDILQLCAAICKACAQECGKHPYQHCQDCANTCKKCADACEAYA